MRTTLDDSTLKTLERRTVQAKIDALDFGQQFFGVRHYGGAFSSAHILTALYKVVLESDDKFILSKGHSCATFYSLLRDLGYDPKIQGHPERDSANGIEITAGSLGHGLPIGLGMAFAKQFKREGGRVYVLMGDGECQEGTTYESVTLAERFKLKNLTAIIDNNRIQGSGFLIEPTVEQLKRLAVPGWDVLEIDGHNFREIIPALQESGDRPRLIVAQTIKGYGVSFMEGQSVWHSKPAVGEDYQRARAELVSQLERLS